MKRVILFISFIFLFIISKAQITYFASASTPSDNGTNAASPVTITVPGSMVTGDLCIVILMARNASATFGVTTTGGQTWSAHSSHQSSTAVLSLAVYWCRYNGTWAANPSFNFSSTTSTTAVMHVFRPTSGSNTWAVDNAGGSTSILLHSASSSTSQPSNSGGGAFTPDNPSTITLAIWSSDDDNTWGSPLEAGYVATGSSQYRNLAGSDASVTAAHYIQSTVTGINSCTRQQATLGGDPGIMGTVVFYEITTTPHSRRINWIMKP